MAKFFDIANNGKAVAFCETNLVSMQRILDYVSATLITVTTASPWETTNDEAVKEAFQALDDADFKPHGRIFWEDVLCDPVSR